MSAAPTERLGKISHFLRRVAHLVHLKFFLYIFFLSALQWLEACQSHSIRKETEDIQGAACLKEHDEYLARLSVYGVFKTYSVLEDARINRAISKLGNELVQASECQDRNIRFIILNYPELNAYAYPGDHIFIFTLLLDVIQSKDELAFVLGHEISHICNRDPLNKFLRAQKSAKISSIVAEIAADAASIGTNAAVGEMPSEFYTQYIHQIIGTLSPTLAANMAGLSSALIADIVNKGYERSTEDRADDEAIRFCKKARHFNKDAFIRYFQRMKKIKNQVSEAEQKPETTKEFPCPFDRVWRNVVRLISSRGVSVSWINKDSGEIRFSERFSRSRLLRLGSGKVPRHGGSLTTYVTLAPTSTSTAVKITSRDRSNKKWVSNGSYESLYLYCLENELLANEKYPWVNEILHSPRSSEGRI